MKRRIVFIVVLVALAVFVGGFAYFQFVMKPQMIREVMAQAPQPTVTVTAEAAKSERWDQSLTAVGTLKAERGVEIANEVEGVVRTINFSSGQEVAAGAELLRLEDSVEQADLKSAQADARRAAADFERNRELVQRGAVARAAYDQALNARDTAAATVDRIKALIAKKSIHAPFAGRLGIRRVDIGQYLPVGTSIVNLQSLDPIYADFPLPEQEFNSVRVGQDVEITLDAYPGRIFSGKVQSIDTRIDTSSRTFLVRAEFGNSDRAAVPGMFANVKLLTGVVKDVVTLPRTAVTYSLYGESALVVVDGPDGAGKVIDRRFVRAGEVRGQRVAIVEGVKPGDVVVTSGQVKLDQGARVKVDNTEALKPPAVRPKE